VHSVRVWSLTLVPAKLATLVQLQCFPALYWLYVTEHTVHWLQQVYSVG
jgi:hypothetical protein